MILHWDSLSHSLFLHFFWVLASGPFTVASRLPSPKFTPWLESLLTPLVTLH